MAEKPQSTIQCVAERYLARSPLSMTFSRDTFVCNDSLRMSGFGLDKRNVRVLHLWVSLVKSPSGPIHHHGESDQEAVS